MYILGTGARSKIILKFRMRSMKSAMWCLYKSHEPRCASQVLCVLCSGTFPQPIWADGEHEGILDLSRGVCASLLTFPRSQIFALHQPTDHPGTSRTLAAHFFRSPLPVQPRATPVTALTNPTRHVSGRGLPCLPLPRPLPHRLLHPFPSLAPPVHTVSVL